MNNLYNDANFLEFVIKCLFRDKQVLQKAVDLQLSPEDFGTITIYQAFVKAALTVGQAPIEPKLALASLKNTSREFDIPTSSLDSMIEFYEYIYADRDKNAPLNADYVKNILADFIKARRYQKLKLTNFENPEELVAETAKLLGDIGLRDGTQEVRTFTPFKDMVLVEQRESLQTGFLAVDGVTKGINYQEFAMIIGHSGSGKTAMAVYSALQNARQHKKVLYLSIEEPGENICNRAYANVFRISYTDLHKGMAFSQMDLREKFKTANELDQRALIDNFMIKDLRGVAPVTTQYLQSFLDQLYEETGYHPDLVYIDQLDYLSTTKKYDQEWQKFSHIAFEVDDLSNHLIGGVHPFSVFLLHQASGKLTRKFSNNEIAGFKGIIKPADLVLAIGRDSTQDNTVSIFSLKSRHAKNFQFDYTAELEFMNFEQLDAGARERMAVEKKDKTANKGSGFNNIPPKPNLLPSTATGFNSPV